MNRALTNKPAAHNVRVDGFVAQMDRVQRHALARELERRDMAEIERAAIAQRIKRAREEAGLSQPEMAEALGTHERTYQNYESVAKPRTPWSLMGDIATITGKTTEWLIHGDRPTPDLLGVAERAQVDDGFGEFRQYVRDIRGDIADSHHERAQEADAIRGLLERQTAILASIEQLLTRQDEILHEIQRVAGGLPTDGELAEFRKDLAALEARAEVGRVQDDGLSGTAGTARRQGQGH